MLLVFPVALVDIKLRSSSLGELVPLARTCRALCSCQGAGGPFREPSKPDAGERGRVAWEGLAFASLPRKEVIQPHLPVRLPCYDFTPLTLHTFGASPLAVGPATSGADDSGGVTGGVYKARERIHRGVLIRDY